MCQQNLSASSMKNLEETQEQGHKDFQI